MATPLSFTPYMGWMDATDPNNIPADLHLIGASDLLRYERFGADATTAINANTTNVTALGSTLGTLTSAHDETRVTANKAAGDVATLTPQVAANTADITNLKKLRALTTKTTSYAIAQTDSVILGNGAAVTLTLPKAVDSGAGKVFTVKNLNAASLTVNVVAGGGSIDGVATKALATMTFATFISDGVNWYVIG